MSELQQTTITAATERIKLRLRRTAEDIVAIGQDLLLIKESLPHGEFLPWIEREFEMGRQTAANFMNVTERFGSNSQLLGISPTALYALAAPSTPDEVVEQVTERVSQGESVSVKEIKQLKEKLKQRDEDLERKETEMNEMLAGYELFEQDYKEAIQQARSEKSEVEQKMLEIEQELEELKNKDPEVKIVEVLPDGFKSQEEVIKSQQKKLKELSLKQAEYEKNIQELSSFMQSAKHKQQVAFKCKTLYAGLLNHFKEIHNSYNEVLDDMTLSQNPDAVFHLNQLKSFLKSRLDEISSACNTVQVHNVHPENTVVMIGHEVMSHGK